MSATYCLLPTLHLRMAVSFWQIIIWLTVAVVFIIVATAKYRLHPFFILLLASFVVGLGVQLPAADVLSIAKDGFGSIMKSLGLIIVLGTTLGVLLERTGSTAVVATAILKTVGEKRAPLAMSLTGFVVGLPVFCDSGYIVLSGLNNSLSKHTGISSVVMSVSLATGLYSVHCLIPPHPGASAAAVAIGVGFSPLILAGIAIAIPTSFVGYLWAKRFDKKELISTNDLHTESGVNESKRQSVLLAFLPVIVPVLLIAFRSFLVLESSATDSLSKLAFFLGDPAIALTVGVLLACLPLLKKRQTGFTQLLQEAVEKAGAILMIIGAGGAFGAVLAATNIGLYFGKMPLSNLGILFPFVLTAVLKTAQGSSTVAIITASSIIKPLLPALGLTTGNGPLWTVLAMGAGSMMISHSNDAYFWVISRFSLLDVKTMLKTYTIATILMAITSFFMVFLLSVLFP